MEQSLNSHIAVPYGFFAILRSRIRNIRAKRRQRRTTERLARLPDYILRDIGRADLITFRVDPATHGG